MDKCEPDWPKGPDSGRNVSDEQKIPNSQGEGGREPILNLPPAVMALCGVLVVIHLARTFALNPSGEEALLVWFAFVPFRIIAPDVIEGGLLPLLWTPLTHALLHGGWEHLIFNTVWLAIFATPVAQRYGAWPMLLIFALASIAGALAFAATTLPALQILVGASGGVAGLTGAAVRFIFQPLVVARHPQTGEVVPVGRRLASLREVWINPRSRWFTLVWVVLNAAAPLLPLLMGGTVSIAWQAHLGGFFAGLFLVPLFERRPQ